MRLRRRKCTCVEVGSGVAASNSTPLPTNLPNSRGRANRSSRDAGGGLEMSKGFGILSNGIRCPFRTRRTVFLGAPSLLQ